MRILLIEYNQDGKTGRGYRPVSGILCDRRISLRVNGKVYKTVVRPAMMYGAETWAVKKA